MKHLAENRLQFISDVGKVLNSSLTLPKILKKIVGIVRHDLGYDIVSIMLVEEDKLVIKEYAGFTSKNIKGKSFEIGQGITGLAAKRKKPINVADALKNKKYLPLQGTVKARSELAVPIVRRGIVLGVLNVEDEKVNAFDYQDMEILTALTDQLAIAIKNLLRKDRFEHAAKRLQTLHNAGKLISASLDLGKTLDSLLRIVEAQFDYKYSAILLVEGESLYVKAGHGFTKNVLKEFRPKIGTGTPGTAVKTKKPILIKDVKKDKRYIDVNSVTRSALAVPIIHEKKAIGAINIESHKVAHFDQDDLELLMAIADQAAHAIANAELFNKVKNYNEDLQKEVLAATEELMEANKELKKLSELKSDFVSTVSHELRTPLTSIQGYVSLVKDGDAGPVTAEQKEFLEIVKEESLRLTRLINDLLDISKIESGKMNLSISSINIQSFLKNFVAEAKNVAKPKNIELVISAPKKIPSVQGDPDKVKQILYNLVSNAIKFSPKGTQIKIKLAVKKDHLQIDIADSGIGIEQQHLDTIFNKFRQIDSKMTREVGGTGLGLAITKHLVSAHKGDIWVKSKFGKGTTFSFTLPVG